jgi:hypothetical protein
MIQESYSYLKTLAIDPNYSYALKELHGLFFLMREIHLEEIVEAIEPITPRFLVEISDRTI